MENGVVEWSRVWGIGVLKRESVGGQFFGGCRVKV
jgi:hypothetical protein